MIASARPQAAAEPRRRSAYAAAALQTGIGAATFLVAKDTTERFTPLQLAWLRIVLGGLLFIGAYAVLVRRRPRLDRRTGWRLVGLGLLGVTINQSCFLFGIHRSTPIHASLLYAFTPVLVLLAANRLLGERLTLMKGAGVVLAVAGVALVLSAQGFDLSGRTFQGDLIILVAVCAWAAYTVLGKPVLRRVDPLTAIAWVFAAGAAFVLPAAPWAFAGFDPAVPGTRGWMGLLYLCVATSGISFTLWYYALARLEAGQLAVFTNLQAPLTALLAWGFLGTVPDGRVMVGGALVLLGVTLVQVPPRRGNAAISRRPRS